MAGVFNQAAVSSYPLQVAHTVDYFSKGIDREGPYYRVEYLINNYSDSDFFINFLLGYATATGSVYGRRAPHQHPLSPNLYCQSAEVVEGLGGPTLNAGGLPFYAGGARVRAEYRTWQCGPVTMTPTELVNQIDQSTPLLWCTQEIEGIVESFLIPGANLKFSDNTPAGVPARKIVPVMVMNLTYHMVPYLPVAALASAMINPLNSTTFLGCAAKTVLFRSFKTVREYLTDGSVAQKIMISYARRPDGYEWTKLPHPVTLSWGEVTAASGGGLMYGTSDLNATLIF